MARSLIPGRKLPVAPLTPDQIERWFGDLSASLLLLTERLDAALEGAGILPGFEFEAAADAYERITMDQDEAERAAVFQLLACVEAHLALSLRSSSKVKYLIRSRVSDAKSDGLGGLIAQVRQLAPAGLDTRALDEIDGWAEWRNWYGHGRRFEVPAPAQLASIGVIARAVRSAMMLTDLVVRHHG